MDATQPTTQERLFEPGRYLACPHVILCRTDISAAAKLVWMALASHLRDGGNQVWPSVSRMASLTGCNRATVIRAIEHLESAGLLVVERCGGRHSVYRICQPDVRSAAGRSQNATGRKMQPVAKCIKTGRKMRPEVLKGSTLKTNTPPSPPQAGGVGGYATRPQRQPARNAAAIAAVATAVAEVFDGMALPTRWRRRLERMDGDAKAFEAVTAADVRKAASDAQSKGHVLGLGHIEHVLRSRAIRRSQQAAQARSAGSRAAATAAAARAGQAGLNQRLDARRAAIQETLEAYQAADEKTRRAAMLAVMAANPRVRNQTRLLLLAAEHYAGQSAGKENRA